ncbi:MAG: molecular chaperone HscC [Clostridiales Family XIII bacterium]|jgi:molecular chaperone HscC|nr:molecular chaperone HscC [Clostridiales Family XIII bacterium]
MPIIGIDLGTTNSLAAVFRDGAPVIIPNSFGEHLTPSVVSVARTADGGEEILTGKIAAERRFTAPNETASVFKRNMGAKKEYKLGGKTFLPEELSSLIIKKLKEDAEVFLGEPVTEAVISCPAYFSEAQRRATKAAGELAGLTVDRIVSEPTAAAVAYGMHEKAGVSKYLIFDLGGGTFDVSILEYTDSIMEVRAVAGDNYLGGEDFTQALIDLFLLRRGVKAETLTDKERAALYLAAEAAKRAFSKERVVTIACAIGGVSQSEQISADDFETTCQPLMARLKAPVIRALSDASVRSGDISAVVLVGGATKMPIIRSFVGKLFGLLPFSTIDPDEAVALGAAVQAAMKERNESIKELLLTDVCSYTLGIEVAHIRANGLLQAGIYQPIIERNTVIPTSRVETFYTVHDNQKIVEVGVYQGESRTTKDNVFLGSLEIPVPPAPAGKESVDVRFTYDVNGILEVEITAAATGETRRAVIEKSPGAMTPEEIEKSLKSLAHLKIHPRDRDEYRYLIEKGERLYQESIGEEREHIGRVMTDFDEVLDRQNREEIDAFAEELREFFRTLETDA